MNTCDLERFKIGIFGLEVLAQPANAEIARPDVMTRVRTRDLTVVCGFIFSGLPLHLRPKKKKKKSGIFVLLQCQS
jgi:hypothetical protein